jgi:hypothetical protein
MSPLNTNEKKTTLKLVVVLILLSSVILALLFKYPSRSWQAHITDVILVLLLVLGIGTTTEWLVHTRRVVLAWAVLALRWLAWCSVVGSSIYMQFKLGHRDILIILFVCSAYLVGVYAVETAVQRNLPSE